MNAVMVSEQTRAMMKPEIKELPAKKLVGCRMTMSLSRNATGRLWQSLMPRREEIKNAESRELYSLQKYPADYFSVFNPDAEFEKWALVPVKDFQHVPAGFETIIIPAGLYAVFTYKGPASAASATFAYIFTEWLPGSGYVLDDRPHYEVMDERYKHEAPDSQEALCIPIRLKQK